mgnify:CR=1 FL=1|jgi:hypothetical protein
MTTIFNNVHGFNLKLPLNTASRQYPDNYGEWIEIIKKPNELPTVKLKTIVLYYRNNGDITAFNSNNYQNIPRGESGGNYRFYNNLAGGKQLGWIWGFPLFDVGREKTDGDVSGNWPLWGSCIGADKGGFSGSDTSGNETMLVDLSANKNIIVLDCSGLQPNDGSGCKDISNNITDLSGNFFMTLRIKKSKETDFIDLNTQDYGSGRRGNWNLWYGPPNTQEYTKWASLVQYEYECDIIGPKGMLDFTFDYFMINDSGTDRPIYQNSSGKKNLAIPNNLSNFNSSRESSCKIITGLQTGDANVVKKRMDITNILTNLSSIEGGGPKRLQIKENWSSDKSSTVVKLIGGWYSDNSTSDLSNCYYGDNIGDGDFQTNMTQTVTHKTEGWKNFIELATEGDNNWSANTFDSIYELNNILWCSLQSPRKLQVRKLYGNNNLKRYITNWIDLSGGNSSNEIIGGGYGRYPNTIDMVRGSKNPYYSSSENGPNTVSINDFVPDTINYLDASPTPLTKDELNFFKVRYQLLIPPGDDEEFEISFTMGDISSSVTTFFRHGDMDGLCDPDGKTNLGANRQKETITLTWDKNSVDPVTHDISMQSIYFTDIASGFHKLDASFNCTDTSLNHIVTDMSKNYDISFNVFQLHFLAKSGDDRKETPYTVKSFNNNDDTTQQEFDISFVPQNYEPYRYINYNKSKLGDSIETNFYFNGSLNSVIKIRPEKLVYNPKGIFVKGSTNDFDITDSILPQNIDISSIPQKYSITGNSTPTDEDIFVLTQSTGQTQITSVSGEYPVAVGPNNFEAIFYSPSSLELGDYFIPDYWRLPDKINTLRTKYPSDYSYFDDWEKQIKVSMVYDILSLSLKCLSGETVSPAITHILINSKNESPQFDAGTKEDGSFVSNLNGSDLIFEVQGWRDLSGNDQLNKSPIVIELSANPGPFGPSGNSFIGTPDSYSGNSPATSEDGINVPYTNFEETYKVNKILLDKMRKDNVATTDASYNGIFTIHISAWDNDVSNNKIYAGTKMNPVDGVEVLLVDLPEITQTNGEIIVTVNNLTNALDMIDSNNSVIITWESFDFSKDTTWVTQTKSNVYWTISRYNISTGKSKVVWNDKPIVDLNENDEYQYIDTDVRVYEKFRYTVIGKFKWDIGSNNLELDIPGFTTSDCFVCKNNRFPYGRFNTTSTNLKLFRPLLINTLEGQVDQFDNKTCGGGCLDVNNTGLNLYSQRSRISSSNNIYSNTTNQMSKKKTYVRLSRSRFRPDR